MGGIAQWVECPIEKSGAILTRVRFFGPARDFCSPESPFCADTFAIVEQLPCGIVYLSICAHVKDPTHWQRGHTQTLHTLVGMGSAALVAAVALPRHGDLNFQKDTNEVSVSFRVHNFLHFLLGDNWEKYSCTTEMKQVEFQTAGKA